jgi:formylglycine-generating enzyme required for sulfatase activity
MVFRPVFIGKGKNPFFLHHFEMGDPTNDFKEYLTRVGIGGAFLGQQHGQQDWLYYLGKYEVTEAQYAAIMGSAASATPSSRSPIRNISWFEAQEFIHKYNLWLFANARDSMPRCGKTAGFLRLPTEVEWEFAARGGMAATAELFRARHPYAGTLNKYEWFAGPSSSHNKLQAIGGLTSNPLALHDMLGNVAEMTAGLYQVEYYQGRVGGFVARGGHYLTQESNMRASLRAEQPFYDSDGDLQPQRSPTLGFRLAISCAIFTALDTTDLQQYWGEWRGSRTRRESPAGSSTAPPTTQANIKLVKVEEMVQQVLRDATLTGDTRRQLDIVQASFGSIETTIKQAEIDQALAWMTMATLRGRYIADALKRLAIFRESIETARGSATKATLDKMHENLARQQKTIDTTLYQYAQNLDQLHKLDKEVREQAFTQYLNDLTRAEDADHIKIFSKAVKTHLEQYPKYKEGDFAQWKADFAKL